MNRSSYIQGKKVEVEVYECEDCGEKFKWWELTEMMPPEWLDISERIVCSECSEEYS